MKKYALLDTDFISKTYSVQDGGNHLIDRVMSKGWRDNVNYGSKKTI